MLYRRHNQWVLGLVAGALAAMAAFSVAIDPVGLWGTPVIPGLSGFKARAHLYEHAFKARAFARRPAPAVFLGTSRVKYGLDPATYERLTGRAAYNLGVGDLPLAGHRALLAHARFHRPDLAQVVLGVGHHDFLPPGAGALARVREGEARLATPWPPFGDLARHALTLTALRDGVATIQASRAAPDARAYAPDGRDLVQPWITGLEAAGARAAFAGTIRRYARGAGALGWDPAQLAEVRRIVEACRAAGIALLVVVPPVHALEYEAFWGTPSWEVLLRGKRELARITPYWDFAGYGPVTTEPLAGSMANYLDVTHFRPAVGDRVLARALGRGGDAGFGRYVTAETVEASIAALGRERAAWVATDPADRRALRALLDEGRR